MNNWIDVNKQLPGTAYNVLVLFKNSLGNSIISIGQYIPAKTVRSEDYLTEHEDCSSLEDYDEDKDCYWVKESWFECPTQFEYGVPFSEKITHWMKKPDVL